MRDRPLLVIAALIAIGTFIVVRANSGTDLEVSPQDALIQTASLTTDEYGIDVSGFEVSEAEVENNETFSDLLTPYNVD
jgi:hypothetical protein